MSSETYDPTLPLLDEIASLKSALATVQDAYTKASLELMAMQRVQRVEPDDETTAMRQPDSDETQWNSLSTRPGRIDRCIYFDNPDHEARLGIARKMLPEDEAVKLAGEGDGLSVAQFSALVRERAMEVVSEVVGEGAGGMGGEVELKRAKPERT